MVAALCLIKPIKNYIFLEGKKEFEWYRKVTTTTKQYKIGQRNTYYWAKKRCLLSCRPQLNIKREVHCIRRDHATIVIIIVLLIFKNVFYLEKSVLSCVIFILKLLHLNDFHACKYQPIYCILFQFIHAIWFVWRGVGCWKCGMLWK